MKKLVGYGMVVIAVGALFVGWKTEKIGMVYSVKNANYIEAKCGEGEYSEKGKWFDIVGDEIVKPFQKCKCEK